MKHDHHITIANAAMEPFTALVGGWAASATHPRFPGRTFHGHTTFEWLEGGAFLVMRSTIDEPQIPNAVAILGSDEDHASHFLLYFDERGVSRKYEMALRHNVWHWWRNAPGFSQRFTGRITDGGHTIVGKWELSENDSTWHPDLELTYRKSDA